MLKIFIATALCVAVSLGLDETYPNPVTNGSRIIGGHEVEIEERPYQVSVQYGTAHFCGGSILDKRTILTAAHCIDVISNPDYLYIRAGSKYVVQGGVRIHVEQAIPHPQYNNKTIENDIAVLKLANPLTYSGSISNISISQSIASGGERAIVSGWGVTIEGDVTAAPILREAEVEIIERQTCRRWYSNVQHVTDTMICAGTPDGGLDACQGDSGGPLVTAHDTQLIGVVSWGKGCARPGYPGVYAEVRDYVSWIAPYLE